MKKVLTAIATAIASFATAIAVQAADLPMEPVYKAPAGRRRLQLDGVLHWRQRWLWMG